MKKVLIVVAHPDDEVLGMGGTIAKLAKNGADIRLLIVTDGSSAQYRNADNMEAIIDEKRKETEKAAKILGISSVHFGKLPDMKLDVTPHILINQLIEEEVSAFCPDAVFTHFWGDINLDHRRVSESVGVACRPQAGCSVKELYSFSVPSATEWNFQRETSFVANVFSDISDYSEKKKEALLAYETELRQYPHPRSAEYITAADRAVGHRVGLETAEQFVLLRKTV